MKTFFPNNLRQSKSINLSKLERYGLSEINHFLHEIGYNGRKFIIILLNPSISHCYRR